MIFDYQHTTNYDKTKNHQLIQLAHETYEFKWTVLIDLFGEDVNLDSIPLSATTG